MNVADLIGDPRVWMCERQACRMSGEWATAVFPALPPRFCLFCLIEWHIWLSLRNALRWGGLG